MDYNTPMINKVKKHSKLLVALVIVVLVLIILHFVPIRKETGYLNGLSANLCIGYTSPESINYRIIPNGFNSYKVGKQFITPSTLARYGSNEAFGCDKPVEIHLFLL